MKKTSISLLLLIGCFYAKAQTVRLPPWSPQERAIMLDMITNSRDIKVIQPKVYRDSICQCCLRGMIKYSPNGIRVIPFSAEKAITDSCKKVVKKPD